jgi:hypothetical protein
LNSTVSTQSAQKVHSNVQMRASVDAGGKSRSQHSQLGRNSSAIAFLPHHPAIVVDVAERSIFGHLPAIGIGVSTSASGLAAACQS